MCHIRRLSKLVTCEPEGPLGRLWSATNVTKLRTLIASDDRTFRDLLAGYVRLLDPCIDLVGEATTTAEALLAIRDQQLDLILLDLSLQPGNALGLVARMWCLSSAAIVLIGYQPEAGYRDAAIAAGALDYVNVFELSTALPAALRRDPKLVGCCGSFGEVEVADWSEPEETSDAGPVKPEAPANPKRALFTGWQYVHLGLALALGMMILAQGNAMGYRLRLVFLLCLAGVLFLELRQLAATHRVEEFPEYR